MKLPTASSLQRALACRASCVLPRSPDTGSEAAERGTALHSYVEAVASGTDPAEALAAVPAEWRHTARALDVDAILRALGYEEFSDAEMVAEEAYAWSPETDRGRILGAGLSRDYSGVTDEEMAGTADVSVYSRTNDCVTIADYKFGHGEVPRARVNAQLRALALYAARAYGAESAHVVVICGREDGSVWLDTDDMSASDLDEMAETLTGLAAQIYVDREAPANVPPTAGDHCRYCRSAAACPLGPLALAVAETSGLSVLASTPAGRTRLLALQVFARRVPDLIDEALRACIERGDTALADGRHLEVETTARRKVGDADAIYAAVLATLGQAEADTAAPIERHATVHTISAAAKMGAPRGQGKAAADALVEELFEAGLVTLTESQKVVAR